MDNESTLAAQHDPTATADITDTTDQGAEIVDELLIEEISIDGMCGVY